MTEWQRTRQFPSACHGEGSFQLFVVDPRKISLKPLKALAQPNNLTHNDHRWSPHTGTLRLAGNRVERSRHGLLALVSAPTNDSSRRFARTPGSHQVVRNLTQMCNAHQHDNGVC